MSHAAFYKNTFWQYGLQAVRYVLPLVTLPYLTRVLEPEGYAIYAYVVSFMTFVQVFVDFGFNLSGTRQIAEAKTAWRMNRVVGSITQARLILCGIAGIAVFCIGSFIPLIHENITYTMFAYLAVCGRSLAPDFLFQGKEQMAPLTTRYLVSKGMSTVLTFVVVHSASELLWIPVLDIMASLIALAWSFVAARRLFGVSFVRVSLVSSLKDMKSSALYCISNISSTLFTGFSTLLIGVALHDDVQISYWALAITAVSAIQALYSPIINSLYPHLVTTHDFRFARKVALVALPFVIVVTVMFAACSRFIMLVMGGEAYLEGSFVLVLISPLLSLSFYGMLFGWPVLGAAGKVKVLTASTMVSGGFSVAALLFLVEMGDISLVAVCLVRCLTEALMCGMRMVLAVRCLNALRDDSGVSNGSEGIGGKGESSC